MRLRARTQVAGRRSQKPASRTGIVTRARIAGLALMIGSAALIGWLITSDDFALDEARTELNGLGYTDPALVRVAIDLDPTATHNVFLLPAQRMERALAALPQVAHGEVSALLPDRLVVSIVERKPVMVVRTAQADYRVDVDGVVLDQSLDDRGDATLGLPVLDDRRSDSRPAVEVGGRLDQSDVSAMLQLLSMTPQTLESGAASLAVSADDEDGFVVTAAPFGWRAIFGHYTPTVRPPDIIGRQVQCLRSLLAAGESTIDTVYLAPLDDRCGTYLPRSTPAPSPSG